MTDLARQPPGLGLSQGEATTIERLRTGIADRYEIEGEIGQGGMAIVFRARDVRHDRWVAIKILRPGIAEAIGAERFLEEIHIEARLQHPGIVPLFDSGIVEGLPFYVMPLVEGETLRTKLRREGQLPVPEALRIARDVGEALQYAHTHGYIHRDIKPENILLTNGRVVLADFGIGRALDESAHRPRTETGLVHGTPVYMSPEQAGGDHRIDERSDQYALACVVFEMLVGEPPFTGVTAQAVFARHLSDTPRLVTVDRPAIPHAVAEAIDRALTKSAADRYGSVDEFVAALSEVSASRTRPWAVAAVVAAAVTVAVAAWWIFQPTSIPIDDNKVVVFPLAERGLGVSDSGSGYDAALMLTQAFEHAEPLRWIDVRSRLGDYGVADVTALGSALAARIALDRGARFYVTGLARQAQDSITILLQLHDAVGDSLVAQSSGTAPRVAGAIPSVAVEAVHGILPALLSGRRVDLSSLMGRDPGAVALWMQGERSYRESRFVESLDFYARAIARDSGLALAAVSAAAAASWLNDAELAAPFLEIALAGQEDLPAKHVPYARGLDAYLRGIADSAVTFLAQALDRDSSWPEARMALGEVYYHLFPWLALAPLRTAEIQFAHAVRSDSTFAPPLVHLTESAVRRGDRPRALQLMRQLEERNPDPGLVQHLGLMLSCLDSTEPPAGWAAQVRLRSLDVFTAAAALSVAASQPRCAKAALRALLAGDTRAGEKWGAFLLLHGILAAEGRWGEVTALVDSMRSAGSRVAETLYVIDLAAGAPFDSQAAAVRTFIASAVGDHYEGTRNPFTLWLMGHWHAGRGELDRTAELASRLATMGEQLPGSVAERFAMGLRARVLLADGDTAASVELLRRIVPRAPSRTLAWDLAAAHPIERLTLARLLLATGSAREALLVAEGFDHPAPAVYLPFIPASLHIRHAAATQLRETTAVEEYRERLVRLGRWEETRQRESPLQ